MYVEIKFRYQLNSNRFEQICHESARVDICLSSDNEILSLISARSGRAARKSSDELRFQKELEEAMRLSSEEASMSSAEIIPCRSEVKDDENEVVKEEEDGDSSFDQAKPSKYGAIVEEAIKETEILAKPPVLEKKRKVEEAWVTKEVTTERKARPKGKKLVIESSDEEGDFVGDESSEDEEFEVLDS